LLAACQGIDLLAPLRTGKEAQKAYSVVRSVSPRLDEDRSLAPDIEAVATKIAERTFATILG
jgi:histidine ammonia-lyase